MLDIDSPVVKVTNLNHHTPKRNNPAHKGAKYSMYTRGRKDQTGR